MNIIFGNYGNGTIALIQWAHETKLQNTFVVNVDTGWAAPTWRERVDKGRAYAKQCGFECVTLISPTMAKLVKDRNSFPTKKFQWCPSFLKGLPLLDWLDDVDPLCEATIIFSKRRVASRFNRDLAEHIEESVHQGDRPVWHPLYKHDDVAYQELIGRAGFEFLPHRSLECDPCIHSVVQDFKRFSNDVISRCDDLEKQVGQSMFSEPIKDMVQHYREESTIENQTESFDMGCGSFFGCGE